MEARIRSGVSIRRDSFGGVAYVPHRDDFFAVDESALSCLRMLKPALSKVPKQLEKAVISLAKLGLCETSNPSTTEIAYSGPSFIGRFRDIATISEPLVVNCFATAFCPLRCVYCHADDLMQNYRDAETDSDIDNVVATVSLIPAMVAVITGGDPLTRPDRAIALIERLAHQKSIVLDTSGVGDIIRLLPFLKKHHVHVRISVDAISEVNNKLRPINVKIVDRSHNALVCASRALDTCISESIPVTVQTVLTSKNSTYGELRDLRDWLVSRGVKHWVLHICVPAGVARRNVAAARKQLRGRPILPEEGVYKTVKKLMMDTDADGLQIDIRCTDTGNTPNSVLLVASNGDLFTEGLAHNGKVKLFGASESRPDQIRRLWAHIDHFGHARRYLNWNKWFYEGQNLEEIAYQIPTVSNSEERRVAVVETEAKYSVRDIETVMGVLRERALLIRDSSVQRDEYFDTSERALAGNDFVLRLRFVNGVCDLCMKGPRFRGQNGEYSRIELEVPPLSLEAAREAIEKQALVRTWFFEKRRTEYRWRTPEAHVVIDEIPEMGHFLEIEGTPSAIQAVSTELASGLGSQESRNYKELFVAFKSGQGKIPVGIDGAEFSMGSNLPVADSHD